MNLAGGDPGTFKDNPACNEEDRNRDATHGAIGHWQASLAGGGSVPEGVVTPRRTGCQRKLEEGNTAKQDSHYHRTHRYHTTSGVFVPRSCRANRPFGAGPVVSWPPLNSRLIC